MTDETLLLKQLKDPRTREQAFTLMVQTYQESLYILVRGILKSHADTDDVLQNAFIKAWGAIDTFRGESRLGTWLYSMPATRHSPSRAREHAPLTHRVMPAKR